MYTVYVGVSTAVQVDKDRISVRLTLLFAEAKRSASPKAEATRCAQSAYNRLMHEGARSVCLSRNRRATVLDTITLQRSELRVLLVYSVCATQGGVR